MPASPLFPRPTSVFLCGREPALLHWVTYALASGSDPDFIWTDVRPAGEAPPLSDPLARNCVPPDRLNVVRPSEILPRDPSAPLPPSAPIAPPPTVARLADFLRLPLHTQRLLTGAPKGGQPMVLILSNAQRMVGLYPTDAVSMVVRTIVDSGAILLVTFAGEPPEGREAFDTVLLLSGDPPERWRDATVRVERAPATGPLGAAGAVVRLAEIPPIVAVLAASLP